MRDIPPPKGPRRILLLGSAIVVAEVVLGIPILVAAQLPPLSNSLDPATLEAGFVGVVVVTLALTALLTITRRTKFHYDERGVYRGNKLLFDWYHVNKVTLTFRESTGSVTLIAPPTFRAVISGPLIERQSYVSYGVALSFALTDGSSTSIPTNLDKMTERGLIEHMRDVSREVNQAIEFV